MPVETVVAFRKTIIQKENVMLTMTTDRATRGYALAQDEGEAFWLLGMLEMCSRGTSPYTSATRVWI